MLGLAHSPQTVLCHRTKESQDGFYPVSRMLSSACCVHGVEKLTGFSWQALSFIVHIGKSCVEKATDGSRV